MGTKYTYDETKKVLDIAVPLTNKSELLAICKEVDESTDTIELDMFINTAHIVVVENLDGYSLSTERLTAIERYLAAHFAAITYAQAVFESVGKVQASYSMKIALNLDQTRYGQQAKFLDPTGELGTLNEEKVKKQYGITWLGMTQEEWEASANATT